MSDPTQSIVVLENSKSFSEEGFYGPNERSDWVNAYAESLYSRYEKPSALSNANPLPVSVTLNMVMGHRDAVKRAIREVEKVIAAFPGTSVHVGRMFKEFVYTDLLTEFIIYAPLRMIRCYVKNSMSVVISGDEYGFTFFPRVIQEILMSK